MKKLHAQRLATLAYNGEKDNLGHRKFKLSDWILPEETTKCGTVGCMVGGCGHVFPRQWKITRNTYGDITLLLRKNSGGFTDYDAQTFFGLDSYAELIHLFISGEQDTKLFGGKRLNDRSKAKDVAYNIWEFLKLKGYKKSDFELKLVK